MRIHISAALFLSLTACVTNPASLPQDVRSERIASATTNALCASYIQENSDALGQLMLEAELASRGETECAGRPIGAQSASLLGRSSYSRTTPEPIADDLDCADFNASAAAQRFFLAAGGPIRDDHNLDADGDGLACEWGTEARRLSRPSPPVVAPVVPRTSYARRCYTGPRGGTYTITASGSRDYNGC